MSSDFRAIGPRWFLAWSPTHPYLEGSDDVIAAVEARLAEDPFIPVTPTGPSVPADVSDPLAVLAALALVAPTAFTTHGSPPTIPEVPDGAIA